VRHHLIGAASPPVEAGDETLQMNGSGPYAGEIEFSVPMFGEFMKRWVPAPPPPGRRPMAHR